jgi:hypothetical protein
MNNRARLFFLLPFLSAPSFAIQKAVVIVPVADLRSDKSLPEPGKSDDKQQTQLLFGETVEVVKSEGEWAYINAIEQPEFTTHQRWEGYPGWVLRKAVRLNSKRNSVKYLVNVKYSYLWDHVHDPRGEGLSPVSLPFLTLGSELHTGEPYRDNRPEDAWIIFRDPGFPAAIPSADIRSAEEKPVTSRRAGLIQTATLLLGDTYVWGGLTPADEKDDIRLTGVDCSGLTHLSYRVNGLTIPRDSMEQYMKAEKIKRAQLKPADLVFSAKADNPQKITHVAMYEGKGQLIEAPQTGTVVRKIAFKEKFGQDFEKVESGDRVGVRVIYFGRFLKD